MNFSYITKNLRPVFKTKQRNFTNCSCPICRGFGGFAAGFFKVLTNEQPHLFERFHAKLLRSFNFYAFFLILTITIHNRVYHNNFTFSRKNERKSIKLKKLLTFVVKLLYNVYSEGYLCPYFVMLINRVLNARDIQKWNGG